MGTRALDLPPRAGWNWLIKGWTLFRKSPSGMLVLTSTYLGIMFFLAVLIPFAGAVLVLILNPGINAGLMTGCRMIDRGLPVTPSVVFSPFFEENRRLAKPFLRLGVWYAICGIGVSMLTSLFGTIDAAQLMQAGVESADAAAQALNLLAITSVLYTPVMMLFWYAPALVLWHDITPQKALFFSLVTVWRNRGAFLLYAMGWMLWTVAIVGAFTVIMSMLPLPAFLSGAINFVMLMSVFAVTLSTFYPSYIDVFEGHAADIEAN